MHSWWEGYYPREGKSWFKGGKKKKCYFCIRNTKTPVVNQQVCCLSLALNGTRLWFGKEPRRLAAGAVIKKQDGEALGLWTSVLDPHNCPPHSWCVYRRPHALTHTPHKGTAFTFSCYIVGKKVSVPTLSLAGSPLSAHLMLMFLLLLWLGLILVLYFYFQSSPSLDFGEFLANSRAGFYIMSQPRLSEFWKRCWAHWPQAWQWMGWGGYF